MTSPTRRCLKTMKSIESSKKEIICCCCEKSATLIVTPCKTAFVSANSGRVPTAPRAIVGTVDVIKRVDALLVNMFDSKDRLLYVRLFDVWPDNDRVASLLSPRFDEAMLFSMISFSGGAVCNAVMNCRLEATGVKELHVDDRSANDIAVTNTVDTLMPFISTLMVEKETLLISCLPQK